MTASAVLTPTEILFKLDDGRSLALLPELPALVWLAQHGIDEQTAGQLLSDAEYEARRRR